MDELITALSTLRVPLQTGEYDLHRLVAEALSQAGIAYEHEVKLAPHCRIDLLCGRIGIEMKRGKPEKTKLIQQLTRYAQCPQLDALILVVERTAVVPPVLCGKPVRMVCLNKLWGIAL